MFKSMVRGVSERMDSAAFLHAFRDIVSHAILLDRASSKLLYALVRVAAHEPRAVAQISLALDQQTLIERHLQTIVHISREGWGNRGRANRRTEMGDAKVDITDHNLVQDVRAVLSDQHECARELVRTLATLMRSRTRGRSGDEPAIEPILVQLSDCAVRARLTALKREHMYAALLGDGIRHEQLGAGTEDAVEREISALRITMGDCPFSTSTYGLTARSNLAWLELLWRHQRHLFVACDPGHRLWLNIRGPWESLRNEERL